MNKLMMAFGAVAAATLLSGCALFTTNTQRSGDNTGYNTTFGLFGFSGLGNDFPLLPLYMHYTADGAKQGVSPQKK